MILQHWDVKRIRADWVTSQYTVKQLALRHQVSEGAIRDVVRNRNWYDPSYTPPDMRKKCACGEAHPRAKLTLRIVRDIRDEYATGEFYMSHLALKYKVAQTHISRIVRNKCWVESK